MADHRTERSSHEQVEIPEPECRRLLATRTLGRVAVTSGALPVIVPVEYVYGDGNVTFGIEADERLRSAADGHVLAFEVDTYDAESGEGWSVHVLGRAFALPDDDAPAFMILDSERHPYPNVHFVRLQCEIVDGHTLTHSCN